MQQECLSATIMTRRVPMTTSARHVRSRCWLRGHALGACAALPDDAPVVENLDEETGLTIARLGRPLELYRETVRKDMAERFAFLGPFETNQMGSRELFLWVAVPMEDPAVAGRADGHSSTARALDLGAAGHAARTSRACAARPTRSPRRGSRTYYFRIDQRHRRAARRGRLTCASRRSTRPRRGPLDLKFSAQPARPRLAEFAAR